MSKYDSMFLGFYHLIRDDFWGKYDQTRGENCRYFISPPHMCISDLISYLRISIFKHFYNSKITLSRFRKF